MTWEIKLHARTDSNDDYFDRKVINVCKKIKNKEEEKKSGNRSWDVSVP